jgi:ATP-dependent RNA helicase DeaD
MPKLFSELGLSPEVLKAIDQLGFEQAAPIQAEAIPLLMQGRDVVGQSQTGSGKTAAFAVPAIEKVDVTRRDTQVIILCPTRELAIQVAEEVHKLALFKRGLHTLPVYGGQSYDRQLVGLRQGAHIVIGTPGRVMDHMRRGTLKLAAIKLVVLDEVDVMLNMGFREDIELILQSTPKERQTVFFSATIPRPIQHLIEKYSRDARQVRIEQKALTVPTVDQVYYEVDRRFKMDLLTRLIDLHDLKLCIIFCNTKRMVDDLVDHLNAQGYSADRLHGDMTQMMRDRVMQKFRKSGLDFLVATDVAARGIDVDDIEAVFNYDLPYDSEDYVHRIGRTGRQGRSGRAISFASGREVFQIRNIERYTNVRIQRGQPPTASEVEEARTLVFLDKLRATLAAGKYKHHDRLIERLLEEGFASTDIISALIHHLQGSDAAPAKSAPRPEESRRDERPPRPPYRDSRPDRAPERPARPPQFAERRQDRPVLAPAPRVPRVERPARPEQRPPPVVPVPITPAGAAKPAIRAVPKPPVAEIVRPVTSKEPVKPVPAKESAKPVLAKEPVKAAPTKEPAKPVPAKEPVKPVAARELVKPVPAREPIKPGAAKLAPKLKEKPRTQPFQKRLWINIGEEMGVVPNDIVNTISGETGLPGNIVGTVDIRSRHLFVDVEAEHANSIIAKLNRTQIKGHKIKVKAA